MELDLTTIIILIGNWAITAVSAFVSVRVSNARQDERISVLRRDTDDLEKALYGNGHAGLKHEVHEHDAILRDHDRRLSCVEVKVA